MINGFRINTCSVSVLLISLANIYVMIEREGVFQCKLAHKRVCISSLDMIFIFPAMLFNLKLDPIYADVLRLLLIDSFLCALTYSVFRLLGRFVATR